MAIFNNPFHAAFGVARGFQQLSFISGAGIPRCHSDENKMSKFNAIRVKRSHVLL